MYYIIIMKILNESIHEIESRLIASESKKSVLYTFIYINIFFSSYYIVVSFFIILCPWNYVTLAVRSVIILFPLNDGPNVLETRYRVFSSPFSKLPHSPNPIVPENVRICRRRRDLYSDYNNMVIFA